MKLVFSVLIIFLLLLAFSSVTAVDRTITVQGRLTDSSDNVLTGDHNFLFRVYTVETGGSAVFFETHLEVGVVNGLFNIILGDTNDLQALDFDVNHFVGITVDSDAEMTPRIRMSSVPTAYDANNAGLLDGLDSTEFVRLNPSGGQVISGTGDLNHLLGHTFLGHTFIVGDDAGDELLVLVQANGSTEHMFVLERSDGSHVFTILPSGETDINFQATATGQVALHIEADAQGSADVAAIEIDLTTGNLGTEEVEEAILISIDQSEATSGQIFAIGVLPTPGNASIFGLGVGGLVNPIVQLSGIFQDADSAFVAGVDRLSEFNSSASNVSLFQNDDDNVTVGNSVKFQQISFVLDTTASGPGIKPVFEHSTGVGTFTAFGLIDSTNGMRESGNLVWNLPLITDDWVVGANNEFIIRITRTANNITTVPIEDKVQIIVATRFVWDQNGSLVVRDVNTMDLNVASGNVSAGSSSFSFLNDLNANAGTVCDGNTGLTGAFDCLDFSNFNPQDISGKLNVSDFNVSNLVGALFGLGNFSFPAKISTFDLNVGSGIIEVNGVFYGIDKDLNLNAPSAGCASGQFLGGDGVCTSADVNGTDINPQYVTTGDLNAFNFTLDGNVTGDTNLLVLWGQDKNFGLCVYCLGDGNVYEGQIGDLLP